jgi:hypothetical protein
MEENWLIIAGFSSPKEANIAASELKAEGIDCHTVVGDGGAWMFNSNDSADWMYLEVREEDYDDAIEILQIDPMTIEEFEASYTKSEERDKKRRSWFTIWAGIFSGVIIFRLLAEAM